MKRSLSDRYQNISELEQSLAKIKMQGIQAVSQTTLASLRRKYEALQYQSNLTTLNFIYEECVSLAQEIISNPKSERNNTNIPNYDSLVEEIQAKLENSKQILENTREIDRISNEAFFSVELIQSQISKIEREINKLKENELESKRKIMDLAPLEYENREKLNELKREKSRLELRLKEIENHVEDKMIEPNTEIYIEKIEKIEACLKNRENKIVQLEEQIHFKEKEISNLKTSYISISGATNKLQQDANDLYKAFDTALSLGLSIKCDTNKLKNELETKEKQLELMKSQYETRKMEIEDQLSEIFKIEENIPCIESEIQRKSSVLQSMKNDFSTKNSQFQELKDKFSSTRKPFYEALFEKAKSEIEKKQSQKLEKEKAKIREAKEVEKNKEFIKIQNRYR
ncbi:unnamed protein product [Blepharisma stoltei]|uniref:Uncharacterized protein n=1 Tax=Blepharisma stoltei TaxID=1481888 RepID=A0AAU9K288_9CILI|nr:unnamed protein product [Blepharisma stoltei]